VITKSSTLGPAGLRPWTAERSRRRAFSADIARVQQDGVYLPGDRDRRLRAPDRDQPVTRDPENSTPSGRTAEKKNWPSCADARRTRVPELSTPSVTVYHIQPGKTSDAARVFGMLADPGLPGIPGHSGVPGAGVHKIAPLIRAWRKRARLHGNRHSTEFRWTLDPSVYASLASGALNGYWPTTWIRGNDNYYRRCTRLRAGKTTTSPSLAELWNRPRSRRYGREPGGALSIVTAGLDPRSTARCALLSGASARHGRYGRRPRGGWPHVFRASGANSNRAPKRRLRPGPTMTSSTSRVA